MDNQQKTKLWRQAGAARNGSSEAIPDHFFGRSPTALRSYGPTVQLFYGWVRPSHSSLCGCLFCVAPVPTLLWCLTRGPRYATVS